MAEEVSPTRVSLTKLEQFERAIEDIKHVMTWACGECRDDLYRQVERRKGELLQQLGREVWRQK